MCLWTPGGKKCQGKNPYGSWCNENFHCDSGKCSLLDQKCASSDNGAGSWCNKNFHCKSSFCIFPISKCAANEQELLDYTNAAKNAAKNAAETAVKNVSSEGNALEKAWSYVTR